MSDDDPRQQIFRAADVGYQESQERTHEATLVKRFLRRFAPDLSIPALLARMGQQQLSADMLPLFLDKMPLRLVATPVRYLNQITATDLLGGNLPGTPLWRAYAAEIDKLGIDLRKAYFGLVTPWTGATAVVLHNWPRIDESLDRGKSYGRFVLLSSKHTSIPVMYSLEPLDALMDALAAAGVCARSP